MVLTSKQNEEEENSASRQRNRKFLILGIGIMSLRFSQLCEKLKGTCSIL